MENDINLTPEQTKPKKLSDSQKELIVSKLQQDIDASNRYYQDEIEPKIIERYDIYKASVDYYAKKFPKLSKRSDVVSTDVADTIESTMPAMMKTFHGSTDVVVIQGADGGQQDDDRAGKMQDLINYQLEKNGFFMIDYQWIKDALITNLGIIKVDWQREYKDTEQQIALSPDALEQFLQDKEIKVISVEPNMMDGSFFVDFIGPKMTVNRPQLYNVLASEFRFSPDATSLSDASFVAHRKIVNIDYLRKQQKAGLYENVEELAEKAKDPEYTTLDYKNNDDINEESNKTDTGRKKVELYECYVSMNMTDDPNGDLEPMIITISNGVIIRIEQNTYGRHPFFTLSPRMDPHKVWPESGFVDLLAQLQHMKTAVMRQMVYNLALNNNSQIGVDITGLVDINDIIEGKQVIRFNKALNQCIQPLPAGTLQPWTFNMLEYIDAQRENRTGITRYNQGLDSNSLNKTATGVNIITQQANQRLELIARIFAETGMTDLFRFLIQLNQMFIDEETVIRLTNGPMTIYPDDLEGDFDLVVNAGMGAGAKETNLQNLQLLKQTVAEAAQVGLASQQQFYNVGKRVIEEIGYKNVDDFIVDPSKQPPQQQQQPKDDKVSESIQAKLSDAPIEVQMQYWSREGYQVDIEMFMRKAQMEAEQEANKIHMQSQAKREEMAVNGHIKQQERMMQVGQDGGFANPVEAGQGGQGIPPNHPAFPRAQAPGNPQQVGGL